VYGETKSADQCASRLLSLAKIKQALDERKAQLFKDLHITEDDLKRVWKEILNDPDAKASDKLACTKIVGDYLKIFNNTPQIAIFQGISKDMLKALQTDRDDAIDVEHTIYSGENVAVEGIECQNT
jgi:phage terminase small subunit